MATHIDASVRHDDEGGEEEDEEEEEDAGERQTIIVDASSLFHVDIFHRWSSCAHCSNSASPPRSVELKLTSIAVAVAPTAAAPTAA